MGKGTVAIIGLAPGTREYFVDDLRLCDEVWGLNQLHVLISPELQAHFTRWFQVHPYEEMVQRQRPEHEHLEWLKQAQMPVYMEAAHPDIPTSVRYPYEEVTMSLGGTYLTSAPAFMVALALYEGFDQIRLYGIDMAGGTEYVEQRPCMEYLLGMAMGKGIQVWLPPGCPLLKGPLYAKTVGVPTSQIHNRMRGLKAEAREVLDRYHELLGSIRMCEEFLVTALKGEEAGGAPLTQDEEGYVLPTAGRERTLGIPDQWGPPSEDPDFIPEGSLPLEVNLEERAQAIIAAVNNR